MHPELFGFVKSWGLMLAISFLIGFWLTVRRGKPRGISGDDIMDLNFVVMVSSLIGVRAVYVLTHLEGYGDWYRVFFVWDGGLTLFGGVLLATAAVAWFTRRRGIRFLVLADIMAPAVVLGIGITRLGCFLSGCCFGKPTQLPWAVHFPTSCPAGRALGDVPIHPSQLYSSLAGFLVFALLLLAEKRPSAPGTTFGRFLALYGITRFLLEMTRYVEPSQMGWVGLSLNQWISIAFFLGGTLLLFKLRRPSGLAAS